MADTPNLLLPEIAAAQAQKHVTHNESLRLLDACVHLSVLARGLTAPPGAPADGARYLVPAGATGAWAANTGKIAAAEDGAWRFLTPRQGWICYVAAEAKLILYDGAAWQEQVVSFENLPKLGVGTTADASNPLSAKLNNTLFTARTAAEGGDGSLRFKLNKELPAGTASQLYQTGFSGRAESGLLGSDDFALKVSPDGTSWKTAVSVQRAGGQVLTPFNPAFSVYGSIQPAAALPAIIKYRFVAANEGGNFNNATGRFTAPVAGRYFFASSTLKNTTASTATSLRKNGSSVSGRWSFVDATPAFYMPMSGVHVLPLAAGDYVEHWLDGGELYDGSDMAVFCGALLG